MSPLLTIEDVAARLQVSRRTVYRLIAEGRLRPIHVGRRTRFTEREVEAYIASLRRAA